MGKATKGRLLGIYNARQRRIVSASWHDPEDQRRYRAPMERSESLDSVDCQWSLCNCLHFDREIYCKGATHADETYHVSLIEILFGQGFVAETM